MTLDLNTDLAIAKSFLDQANIPDKNADKLLPEINSFIKSFFQKLPEKRTPEMDNVAEQIKTNLADAITKLQPKIFPVKKEEFKEEKEARTEYIFNENVNLVCEAPTHLMCPGLRLGRMPYIGYYNEGNEYQWTFPLKVVRLRPSQFDSLPDTVRKAVGDLKGRSIDLFLNIHDTSMLRGMHAEHYNLVTHPWVFPGVRENEDKSVYVQQGVFEASGVYKLDRKEDSLQIGDLGICKVHAHPKEERMACSPDNGQFGISTDAPFSSFISVTLSEDRVLVSFQLLLNDLADPFSELIQKYLVGFGKGILTALPKLKEEAAQLDNRETLALRFSIKDPEAMNEFSALSEGEKQSIYGETWVLKGAPMGIDSQFGRNSFHRTASLDAKYHASDEQRSEAIRKHSDRIKNRNKTLMNSLLQLFAEPKKTFPISEKKAQLAARLAPIAASFKQGKEDVGMFLFNELPKAEKNKVYATTWEYKNSPIKDKFGEHSFHADKSLEKDQRCNNLDRSAILNLAAHQ